MTAVVYRRRRYSIIGSKMTGGRRAGMPGRIGRVRTRKTSTKRGKSPKHYPGYFPTPFWLRWFYGPEYRRRSRR